MLDKKTFVLAVAVSWVLTLVTVLLISNFAASLTQGFNQQFTETNSVKVVTFTKQEVQNISETITILCPGSALFLQMRTMTVGNWYVYQHHDTPPLSFAESPFPGKKPESQLIPIQTLLIYVEKDPCCLVLL